MKPTLQEIADMPFPRSINAVRKHYDRHYGVEAPEGEDGKQLFSVEVEWSVLSDDSGTYDVWADNEEEAARKACDLVEENNGDVEIHSTKIMESLQ